MWDELNGFPVLTMAGKYFSVLIMSETTVLTETYGMNENIYNKESFKPLVKSFYCFEL